MEIFFPALFTRPQTFTGRPKQNAAGAAQNRSIRQLTPGMPNRLIARSDSAGNRVSRGIRSVQILAVGDIDAKTTCGWLPLDSLIRP
jgi:hypothetical protein